MKRLLLPMASWLLCSAAAIAAPAFPDNFVTHDLAKEGDVSVSFLSQKLGPEEEGWNMTNYLVIRHAGIVYVEPFTRGWPNETTASVLSLGKDPVIAFTAMIYTTNQSGRFFLRLYRVTDDRILPFSADFEDPPAPGPKLTVLPGASGGWSRLKVEQDSGSDKFKNNQGEQVLYLRYDPAKDAYLAEDYTAGFATRTVHVDGGGVAPDYDVSYFQLNDDHVNLRQSPATTAAVLSTLPRSALFSIVDRTDSPQTIGGKTARWYKVVLEDAKTAGWIFGAFIAAAR